MIKPPSHSQTMSGKTNPLHFKLVWLNHPHEIPHICQLTYIQCTCSCEFCCLSVSTQPSSSATFSFILGSLERLDLALWRSAFSVELVSSSSFICLVWDSRAAFWLEVTVSLWYKIHYLNNLGFDSQYELYYTVHIFTPQRTCYVVSQNQQTLLVCTNSNFNKTSLQTDLQTTDLYSTFKNHYHTWTSICPISIGKLQHNIHPYTTDSNSSLRWGQWLLKHSVLFL